MRPHPAIRGRPVMFSTTTNTVEGRPVREYLGIVTGEVIVGANIFRDLFASITDIVGGRSGKYEDVLARARKEALGEMEAEAAKLRSEEHTSELQSLMRISYAVFCLKKKTQK